MLLQYKLAVYSVVKYKLAVYSVATVQIGGP